MKDNGTGQQKKDILSATVELRMNRITECKSELLIVKNYWPVYF